MKLTIKVEHDGHMAEYVADMALLNLLRGGAPALGPALVIVVNKLAGRVAARKMMYEASKGMED